MQDQELPLAEQLLDYIKAQPEDTKATINDFYDHIGLEEKYRTDFTTAAILKGYKALCEKD